MYACALGLAFPLVQSPPPRVSVLFLGVVEVYDCAGKVTECKTKRIGALGSLVPREPSLPRAFVSRNLLGVVVPDPGVPGRWEGGLEFLCAVFAGRAQGPLTSSRWSCGSYRERRRTWSPRRCGFQPALDCGRGRRGRIQSG